MERIIYLFFFNFHLRIIVTRQVVLRHFFLADTESYGPLRRTADAVALSKYLRRVNPSCLLDRFMAPFREHEFEQNELAGALELSDFLI